MPQTTTNVAGDGSVSYLFGNPIAHSLSPLLHNTVYSALNERRQYQLFESDSISAFLRLLKDSKCFGSAVTMPHKVAILPYLDELTEEGREVGAVNTIFIREKQGRRTYIGTNTDVIGIREAFHQNVKDLKVIHGRPGLVIGGGGAARSAVYALNKWLKCSKIYLVNRDVAEVNAIIESCKGFGSELLHVKNIQQAQDLPGPGAIVGCVPDIRPRTEAEKEARAVMQIMFEKGHKGAFLEMAYHPSVWTELGRVSEEAGWQLILGTEAMIWQGLEQDRLWLQVDQKHLPAEQVKAAIAKRLQKESARL